MITPQQAYEKRYAAIDNGQHTWEAAPDHVKDLWLAAWTIAWVQAEAAEREACAKICDARAEKMEHEANDAALSGEREEISALRATAWQLSVCAAAIRARGEIK